MSAFEVKTGALLDQQLALSAYLEALLVDSPAEEMPAARAPVTLVALPPAPLPAAAVVAAVERATPDPEPQPASPLRPQAMDQPAWAQGEFQSLLFQVAGLTLAVPLVKLNGVLPLDLGAVTPMPGHSELFLGLINHLGQQVRVVDTARMVLPPERMLAGATADRVSHLVLIGEGRWGLAASAIGQVISLRPEDVKWRGSQGQRPWLAGTVIQHMCALLEVEAFLELLVEGTRRGGVA